MSSDANLRQVRNEADIAANVAAILAALPEGVHLVAAAKGRTAPEVAAAIRAGVKWIGHNYVQEAERMKGALAEPAEWHLIGHLQRNKARRALALFDMIQTLDSLRLAQALERHAAAQGTVIPVLIEVNSGREPTKTGVMPEDVDELVEAVARLRHLRLLGLMTMGPRFGNPEDARPYFRATRQAFERLRRRNIPGVEMRYLSMGMSNSWQVAVEEGANIVRIGTQIFGPRYEDG